MVSGRAPVKQFVVAANTARLGRVNKIAGNVPENLLSEISTVFNDFRSEVKLMDPSRMFLWTCRTFRKQLLIRSVGSVPENELSLSISSTRNCAKSRIVCQTVCTRYINVRELIR